MPAPAGPSMRPARGALGGPLPALPEEGVLFLPEEGDPSSQPDEAGDAPKVPGALSGSLGGSRGRTASLLAAGAALVSCAVLAAYGGAARRGSREGGSSGFSGKGAAIGSKEVPEDLDSAPEPEHFTIGHPAYHCTYATNERCPASELFFSPEVHEAATDNLMQVGRGIFPPADRDLVRETVKACFRNVSNRIKEHAGAIQALGSVELDAKERDSVLTWIRLMSVPQVQSIGYDVALAMRRSLTSDPFVVRTAIEEVLSVNIESVKELRDKLVAPRVLDYWGPEQQWELTLNPENMAVMQAFRHGEFYGSIDVDFYSTNVSGLVKELPGKEKAYGVWGGVLEQGRALIDVVKLLARRQNIELLVPPQATSLDDNVDVEDLGSELLSCELQPKDGMNNLMKAVFCPLKYGSQGIDALRAVDYVQGAIAAPA